MRKIDQNYLAKIVTLVFSPLIWVPFGIEFLLWRALNKSLIVGWQILLLSIFFIFLPVLFFFYFVSRKRLDFDLSEKRERLRFFVFAIGCDFLGLNLVYYFSAYLFRVFLALTFTALAFVLVTFWSRASLHIGGLTAVYLVLNYSTDWRFFYLCPIIPLVAWSRIVLKKHNRLQVLEGFLIPLLTIPISFFLLNIP